MIFRFFKSYKWYQITQSITMANNLNLLIRTLIRLNLPRAEINSDGALLLLNFSASQPYNDLALFQLTFIVVQFHFAWTLLQLNFIWNCYFVAFIKYESNTQFPPGLEFPFSEGTPPLSGYPPLSEANLKSYPSLSESHPNWCM